MHPVEDDLVGLMNRALAAPIKLVYGSDRLASLERQRLYWARTRARQRAHHDRFSHPPPIPLDHLAVRIRDGDLYIGRAEVLNGLRRPSLAEQRPRPSEQPVSLPDLAGLTQWPPPFIARSRRPPAHTRDRSP